MRKILCRLASGVLVVVVSVAAFGNGGQEQGDTGNDDTITLTYLYPLGSGFQVVESMADNAVIRVVNEIKNVDIKFIHPPQGQENEQFNLMLASDELPDMLTHGWGIPQKFPGGADKAINDGVYIPLNDLMDTYAPNLKKIVTKYDNVRKDITTDAGQIWGFPMVDRTVQPQWQGPTIRKDLFDQAGLDIPETVGEWHDALTYFVDHKEDLAPEMEAPLIMDSNGMGAFYAFISAYGVCNDFYQVGGKVLYGPLQPGFKDYLMEMNKWYGEGLIHPDFAAGINRGAYITTGKAVALMTGGFWEFDGWKITSENPGFRVVAAPYPSLKKGEKVQISYMARRSHLGYHTPVTTRCKYPERAVDWMDWFYSDEGSLLANWGVEGEDWEWVDGARRYTDKIAKNAEGVSIPIIYFKYLYSHGAFLREWDRELPSYGEDAKESGDIWLSSGGSDNMIPTFTSITSAESNEYTGIMGDVTTYVNEMMVKYISGEESFDEYDRFLATIQKMNIEKATEIKQKSLDRFNRR